MNSGLNEMVTVLMFGVPRLLGLFLALPMFAGKAVGGTTRILLALSFSLFLYPVIESELQQGQPHGLFALVIVIKEVLLGFAIGFVPGLLFWMAQGIADFAELQSGNGLAAVFDPGQGEQTTPLGRFFFQCITVIFLVSGGLRALLEFVFEGYRIWPVISGWPRLDLSGVNALVAATGALLKGVLLYSFPMVFAMVLVTMILGLINRFVPSMHVLTLQFPVQRGLLLLVLIVYAAILFSILQRESFSFKPLLESILGS